MRTRLTAYTQSNRQVYAYTIALAANVTHCLLAMQRLARANVVERREIAAAAFRNV
jgi:hypothetical protein